MTATPKDDGGPAFPVHRLIDYPFGTRMPIGMTLRDWFVGQAVSGLSTIDNLSSREIVQFAYETADIVMKLRAQRKEPNDDERTNS